MALRQSLGTEGGFFAVSLEVVPITLTAAKAYIAEHHRHHKPPAGGLFAVSAVEDGKVVGIAVVSRPVARMLQDGRTAEVTRLCTDGSPNACSMLYAACWRAAKAMGYRRLLTYILHTEPGTSLKAAGWRLTGIVKGRSWDTPSRRRTDKHPTIDKQRWEAGVLEQKS
jgi:hypothetical protein